MAELGIFNAQSRLQDMLARRRQEQMAQRNQLSQLFGNAANTRKGAAANSVAAQLGSGFGQGLATGLFGEGQQIEQARENVETEQQLQQRIGQLDPSDPESYMKIGQELNRAGLTTEGMSFIQAGQQATQRRKEQQLQSSKQDARIIETNAIKAADSQGLNPSTDPIKYNQFIASRMSQSNNPFAVEGAKEYLGKLEDIGGETLSLSKGERVINPRTGELIAESQGDQYVPLSNQEKIARNLDPSVGYQINLANNKVSQIGGGGVSVSFEGDGDAKVWNRLSDNYRQDTKSIREDYDTIGKIKASLNTEGGASPRALQASIAELFGGQTRAIAELQRWANFGALPERVEGSINKFFTGDYTQTQINDISRLVQSYEKYLAGKHAKINERIGEVAAKRRIDPTTVVAEPPEVIDYNFDEMDTDRVLEVDPNTLLPHQRQEFEERVDKLVKERLNGNS